MALAARLLGIRAVVVMPETAPRVKVEGAERLGAEVLFAGTTVLDRKARAESEAAAHGLTMVPPFDHPWIIAGQGTCGLEIVEQYPAVSAVYVPMGGGGLISGVSVAVKSLRRDARDRRRARRGAKDDRVTRGRASRDAAEDGEHRRWPAVDSSRRPHVRARAGAGRRRIDGERARSEAAVKWLFDHANVVAEPSGAASVAAVLRQQTCRRQRRRDHLWRKCFARGLREIHHGLAHRRI